MQWSNSDPHQDQDACFLPSKSLEDTSKGSYPSDSLESSIQNILETISSSRGIDHPENIHPPETGSSILSKITSSQPTLSAPSYICRVCYAARLSHVSHIVHDFYFNASSYRKQQILLPQSRTESSLLQKYHNMQIMRLLNPA